MQSARRNRTVQDFIDRVPAALASVFGPDDGTFATHLQRIELVGKNDLGPHVAAAYTPEGGGAISWQLADAQRLQRHLARRAGGAAPLSLPHLAQLKSDLGIFFHETVHAVGPSDENTFAADFLRDVSDAGATAAREGLTELVAEEFLNDFIRATGLDQIDPRMLSVKPADLGTYPGQVEAMRELVAAVARIDHPGLPAHQAMREELALVAREGCSSRSQDRLLRTLLAADGVPTTTANVNTAHRLLHRELVECRLEFDEFLTSRPTEAPDTAFGLGELRRSGRAHGEQLVHALSPHQHNRVRLPRQPADPWRSYPGPARQPLPGPRIVLDPPPARRFRLPLPPIDHRERHPAAAGRPVAAYWILSWRLVPVSRGVVQFSWAMIPIPAAVAGPGRPVIRGELAV